MSCIKIITPKGDKLDLDMKLVKKKGSAFYTLFPFADYDTLSKKDNIVDVLNTLKDEMIAQKQQHPVYGVNAIASVNWDIRNAGTQLSYDHETEHSHMSIPTQIINAAVLMSLSYDRSVSLYRALGSVVKSALTAKYGKIAVDLSAIDKNLLMTKFDEISKDDFIKSTGLLPASMKDELSSFINGSNNNDVVYGDFITAFILKNIKDTVDKNSDASMDKIRLEANKVTVDGLTGILGIPVDSSAFYNFAFTTVANAISKNAIKGKYAGTSSILVPSTHIHMIHEVSDDGGVLPIEGTNGQITGYKKVKKGTILRGETAELFKSIPDNMTVQITEGEGAGTSVVTNNSNVNLIKRDLRGAKLSLNIDGTDVPITDFAETKLLGFSNELNDLFKSPPKKGKEQEMEDEFKDLIEKNKETLELFRSWFDKEIGSNTAVDTLFGYIDGYVSFETLIDTFVFVEKVPNAIAINAKAQKNKAAFNNLARRWQNQLLDNLKRGEISKVVEYNKAFANGTNYSFNATPAELGLPSLYRTNFMLREGDDINDVSVDFFKKRLAERHAVAQWPFKDVILNNKGNHQYIVAGKQAKRATPIDYITQEDEKGFIWRLSVEGKKMHPVGRDGEVMFSVKKLSDGSEVIVPGDGVNTNDIQSLLNKGKEPAHRQAYYKVMNEKDAKAPDFMMNVGSNLDEYAVELYESFKMSLQFVAGRIPSQHFQSVMPMKVVFFHEADNNAAIIPYEQVYLQGSDFDIDKLNAMALSFDKDSGRFLQWSPFSHATQMQHISDFELAGSLDYNQAGRYTKNPNDAITTIEDSEVDIIQSAVAEYTSNKNNFHKWPNYGEFARVMGKLVRSINAGEAIYTSKQAELNRALSSIMDIEKTWASRNLTEEGYQNFVANTMHEIFNDPRNHQISYNPVEMDQPALLKKMSAKAGAINALNYRNPMSMFIMRRANSEGKAVVGVAATSLKVLSGSTQGTTEYMKKVFKEMAKQPSEKQKRYFATKMQDMVFRDKDHNRRLITNINVNLFSPNEKVVLAKFLFPFEQFTTDIEALKKLQEYYATQEDIGGIYSAVLSAATDL